MTRISRGAAIRSLFGVLAGLFVETAKGQRVTFSANNVEHLAELHFGDPAPVDPITEALEQKSYEECMAGKWSGALCLKPGVAGGSSVIPGTAKMVLNLDGWKGFEVKMGGETITISRQEIWDALREGR